MSETAFDENTEVDTDTWRGIQNAQRVPSSQKIDAENVAQEAIRRAQRSASLEQNQIKAQTAQAEDMLAYSNASRGIQKKRRIGPETVAEHYLGEGLVHEKEKREIQEEDELASSDAESREQAMVQAQQAIGRAQLGSILMQKRVAAVRKERVKKMLIAEAQKTTKLFASRSVAKSGIAVACTIYAVQFPMAVLSAMGFALHGQVRAFEEWVGSPPLIGGVLKWITQKFTQFLPFELIGYVTWGFVMILLLASFIGYFLWFRFLQLDPIGSGIAFLITASCICLSLIPITNIFPWIVLWVIYMSFFAPSA